MIRLGPQTLRGRLASIFAVASTTVVLSGGVLVYTGLTRSADRSVTADLRARVATIQQTLAAGNLELPRREPYAQVYVSDGTILTYTEGLLADGERVLSNREIDLVFNEGARVFHRRIPALGGHARLLAAPASLPSTSVVIVVGASLRQTADARHRLFVTFALSGPAFIAMFAAGGWLLAGAALHPVRRMTADAAAITTADIGQRLSVPGNANEIGELGQTLNAMLDRIEQGFRRERQFVDDASHELRTPLSIMRAELDLAIGDPNNGEDVEATLLSVSDEVQRLTQLADDLLVLARAGAGQLAGSDERSDLLATARFVADRLELALPPGVAISVAGEGRFGQFAQERLQRVLTNLITNAARHARTTVHVRVGADATGRPTISVADDGPGFPPGLLPHAFERFTVADAARTRGATATSTGLGLAIVKALVEAEGGSVHVRNEGPLGGAVATLTIPM